MVLTTMRDNSIVNALKLAHTNHFRYPYERKFYRHKLSKTNKKYVGLSTQFI